MFKTLQADGHVQYAIFQLERGEEKGTEHYQGYVQTTNKKAFAWIKKHISSKAHWSKCRGSPEDNIRYCSKEETRVAGPWTVGKSKGGQGTRTDYERVRQTVLKHKDFNVDAINELHDVAPNVLYSNTKNIRELLYMHHPEEERGPVEIITLIGPSSIGKTKLIQENCTYYDSTGARRSCGYQPYQGAEGNFWFCGYNGQTDLVFDDFRAGSLKLQEFLKIFDRDGHALRLPTKGSSVPARYTRIWISSNMTPDNWFHDMSRSEPRNWTAVAKRLCFNPDDCKPTAPNFINLQEGATSQDLKEAWNKYTLWASSKEAQVCAKLLALF